MRRDLAIVRESAIRVADAADRALNSYRENRVEHEPELTDRILGGIEESLNEFEIKGIRWRAKTLTSRGPNSQETRYGADFVGVLQLNLPGYSVTKGFLAQAKRVEPRQRFNTTEFDRMKNQCESMLRMTPDSFVFLYSRIGIHVVPAISLLGATPCNPYELYTRSLTRFYEEHFQCFVGDRNITEESFLNLEDVVDRALARRLLGLTAQSV